MKTLFVNPKQVERKWYLIDAAGQRLGRVATLASSLLRGKNKPEYTPHQEVGDYVIVVNADKVIVTGRKATQQLYARHSGYPGALSRESLQTLRARRPEAPLERAVRGMLPKNRLGRTLFTNLKVYSGARHPHEAQKPESIQVPAVKEA